MLIDFMIQSLFSVVLLLLAKSPSYHCVCIHPSDIQLFQCIAPLIFAAVGSTLYM